MESKQDALVKTLRRSRIRKGALKALLRSMRTAPQIAAQTNLPSGHIKSALNYLLEWKAVSVINPYDKNPDIFSITETGKKALKGSEAPVTNKGKTKAKTFRLSGKRRNIS